jgi:hypothetical protein
VLRELAALSLTFKAVTSGSACTLELPGAKTEFDCTRTLLRNGADFGVGIHEIKLRVASGPNGLAECTKSVRVDAPSPCKATWVTPKERADATFKYDELGRMTVQDLKYTTGALQTVTHTYAGTSRNVVKRVTALPTGLGVRNETVTYRYVAGPENALGERPERVDGAEVDDQSDGKIDTRQAYTYDKSGLLATIDQDNGADGSIDGRHTHTYDAKGRLKTRDYASLDGKTKEHVEWTYDALGVLQTVQNQTHSTTWTQQYVCQ